MGCPDLENDTLRPTFVLAWVTKKGEPVTKMGDGSSVLFVEHPSRGWEIPGGHLEQGETAEEALLRELEEETGIVPELVKIVAEMEGWIPYELPHDLVPKLWNGKYRGQEQKWFLLRFLGEDAQINIKTLEPEFVAWKWINPTELPEVIVPFKRHIYERVLTTFEQYL